MGFGSLFTVVPHLPACFAQIFSCPLPLDFLVALEALTMKLSCTFLSFAAAVAAHGDHGHDQEPLAGPHEGLWYNTLPGDGGTQV